MRPSFGLFLAVALAALAYGQERRSASLVMELNTDSAQVKLSGKLRITIHLSTTGAQLQLWNFLTLNGASCMELQVRDASGKVVRNYGELFDPAPPDPESKRDLVTIGPAGRVVYDYAIPAKRLFPRAGIYTLKSTYLPTLPRNYFKEATIWGKEDGPIESVPVRVVVQ